MGNLQPTFKRVSSPEELQKAFIIRGIVFVEEQKCSYMEEYDKYDREATHFLAEVNGEPVATARIRNYNGNIKFERLAVRSMYRGTGLGKDFFQFILDYIESLGIEKIVMHSQSYVTGFYEKFGFVKKGDLFIEAGIEHYCMEKVMRAE